MEKPRRKIGLIELYDHSEVLLTFFRLLQNDFELTVFTTQKIHQDASDFFQKDLKNWIAKPEAISKKQFVKKNISKLEEQNILIFVTLIDSFRFFSKINFTPKTLLIIHNVNTMLQPQKNIWLDRQTFKNHTLDQLRSLRNKIRRDDFYKNEFLKKTDFIAFPNNILTNYARSLKTEFSKKIIDPIPFSFFEKRIEKKENTGEIIISVPGVILQHVRDYELLCEVFSEWVPRLQKKVKLQFLGSAQKKYAQDLAQRFQALEGEFFKVIFFQKPLPQKDFDSFLGRTDFAILPIKKYKKFGIIREEYGLSNISGGLSDVVRFGIPTLLASHYQVEADFQNLISYFDGKKELSSLLEEWIESSNFTEIQKKAMPFLESKSEERVRNIVIENIQKLKM